MLLKNKIEKVKFLLETNDEKKFEIIFLTTQLPDEFREKVIKILMENRFETLFINVYVKHISATYNIPIQRVKDVIKTVMEFSGRFVPCFYNNLYQDIYETKKHTLKDN